MTTRDDLPRLPLSNSRFMELMDEARKQAEKNRETIRHMFRPLTTLEFLRKTTRSSPSDSGTHAALAEHLSHEE